MRKMPLCPKCGKTMTTTGATNKAGRRRYQCYTLEDGKKHYCYSTTDPSRPPRGPSGRTVGPRRRRDQVFHRVLGDAKRFLVTSAQNATPRHEGFLKAAARMDAEIIVIPYRYKNPTSRWPLSAANAEVWDVPREFLCNTRKRLNKNLVLCGDVKIEAASAEPIRGLDAFTMGESGIFGHGKLQLHTVPVTRSRFPKIVSTTGACTVDNYTDTRRGKIGEFHHTIGAALIELGDGGLFHLRQINADKATGAFIDLDKWYTPDGIQAAPPAEALVMGDTHCDAIDPGVEVATFGDVGMVRCLSPKRLVWHDLDDNYSVNPHHRGNPFIAMLKRQSGKHLAMAEADRACQFVIDKTPNGVESIVVFSNHNEFLARWIMNTDWRTLEDQSNIDFYLSLAQHMNLEAKIDSRGARVPDPFTFWARQYFDSEGGGKKTFTVLNRGQSHMIMNIECGMHGDDGPNGARGSLYNLRRIGNKFFIGHVHGPGIFEGGMAVGTSTPRSAEYTHGPGNWLNTHGVVYANGKRSLLTVIGDQWRS